MPPPFILEPTHLGYDLHQYFKGIVYLRLEIVWGVLPKGAIAFDDLAPTAFPRPAPSSPSRAPLAAATSPWGRELGGLVRGRQIPVRDPALARTPLPRILRAGLAPGHADSLVARSCRTRSTSGTVSPATRLPCTHRGTGRLNRTGSTGRP